VSTQDLLEGRGGGNGLLEEVSLAVLSASLLCARREALQTEVARCGRDPSSEDKGLEEGRAHATGDGGVEDHG